MFETISGVKKNVLVNKKMRHRRGWEKSAAWPHYALPTELLAACISSTFYYVSGHWTMDILDQKFQTTFWDTPDNYQDTSDDYAAHLQDADPTFSSNKISFKFKVYYLTSNSCLISENVIGILFVCNTRCITTFLGNIRIHVIILLGDGPKCL